MRSATTWMIISAHLGLALLILGFYSFVFYQGHSMRTDRFAYAFEDLSSGRVVAGSALPDAWYGNAKPLAGAVHTASDGRKFMTWGYSEGRHGDSLHVYICDDVIFAAHHVGGEEDVWFFQNPVLFQDYLRACGAIPTTNAPANGG